MFDQTATVVLEGPQGEERRIKNVESVVTNDDGSISVETSDRPDLREIGWDWTIRDVHVSWDPVDDVDVGEYVTYTNDGEIQRGKVTSKNDDELVVKQLPDGWMVAIGYDDIIPE